MTKAEIISFVWNNLQKVDKTNKYHRVVIEKAITIAFNQGYTDIFDRDPRLLDNYTVSYGASGSITPAANATTGILEATLPVEYVPFPDKASGVRKVIPENYGSIPDRFYPMNKQELVMAGSTLYGEIDDRWGYVVRKDILQLYKPSGAATFEIRIDIVQPFDAYSSSDTVIIPFGKDAQLLTAVIEILRTIPPVDLQDNNADNG